VYIYMLYSIGLISQPLMGLTHFYSNTQNVTTHLMVNYINGHLTVIKIITTPSLVTW
jgi:hypothetical protein